MDKMTEIEMHLTDLRGHVAALNCWALCAILEMPPDLQARIRAQWKSGVESDRTFYLNSPQSDGFLEAYDKYVAILDSAISPKQQ